jgi:O-methyltransferase involved in polyketide biosynthesis
LLPAAGFDSSTPTVFVIEGLTMYLSESTVRTVLSDLATLCPLGSRLAVNFTVRGGGSNSPVSAAIARTTRAIWRARGEPTHGWVRAQTISEVLRATSWNAHDVVPAPQLAARYLHGLDLKLDGLNPGAICVAAVRA